MSTYRTGGFGNYYRPSFFGGGFRFFPPVIKWLLISNVAIWFFFDVLLGMFSLDGMQVGGNGGFLSLYFALWPFGENFWPWQLVTYMFMHGGLGHLFFNMLALWMFGMELENNWGTKRFLTYYLVCGIGAGITNLLMTTLMGQTAPTVGASGAVFGVLIAFGLLFPDRPIYIYFLLPVRAKYFIAVYIGLELFYGVTGTSDGIAHFAHLGGAAVGALYTLSMTGVIPVVSLWNQWHGTGYTPPGSTGRFSRPQDDVRDAKYYDIKSGRPLDDGAEVSQEIVDAILDKISSSGYQSLTEKEKHILNEASKKIH